MTKLIALTLAHAHGVFKAYEGSIIAKTMDSILITEAPL